MPPVKLNEACLRLRLHDSCFVKRRSEMYGFFTINNKQSEFAPWSSRLMVAYLWINIVECFISDLFPISGNRSSVQIILCSTHAYLCTVVSTNLRLEMCHYLSLLRNKVSLEMNMDNSDSVDDFPLV